MKQQAITDQLISKVPVNSRFLKLVRRKIVNKGLTGLLLLLPAIGHSQLLDLAELPLTLVNSQDPNLIVTVDTSIDMASASSVDEIDWITRSSRAWQFNKLAYNPDITYLPPRNADGSSMPDANPAAAIFGFYRSRQETVDIRTAYRVPELSGRSESSPFAGENTFVDERAICTNSELCDISAAHYYVHSGAVGCDARAQPDVESCYSRVEVALSELSNFANWFQYYSTRMSAAKTVLSIGFAPENFPDRIRVGRQTTSARSAISAGPVNSPVSGVRSFESTNERENFYDWFMQLENGVSRLGILGESRLPSIRRSLQRAGEFASSTAAYRSDPADSGSNIESCRRNEHILVAAGDNRAKLNYDGGFGTAVPIDFSGIISDNAPFTLPDGESYDPAATPIYAGPTSQSAADISFSFWAQDLFGDQNNNEVPPLLGANQTLADLEGSADYFDREIDPATWQHLRTSYIGFGVRGVVPVDDPVIYQGLLDGSINWPDPFGNAVSTVVDDLNHAAINSRGHFGNLFGPDEFVSILSDLVSVSQSTSALSAVATSTGRTVGNDLIFTAEFDTELNIGRLIANSFSDGSDFVLGEEGSNCNERIFGTLCNEEWDAARENTSGSPQFTQRNIFSYDPDLPEGDRGIDFIYSSLNPRQQQLIDHGDGNVVGEQRLDYIRGDTSNELDGNGGGRFRPRSSPDPDSGLGATYLGPVVHSNPVFVSNGENANGVRTFNFADSIPGAEGSAYDSFVSGTLATRPPLVLVGANDGMLHGFNASSGAAGGREEFAYVPNILLERLGVYSDPSFRYASYVDGPIVYQDAYWRGDWHSMVVGGLRAGGQGYFALDITDVGGSNTPDADDVALWEFSDEQDADMGYSYGTPQIVRTNDNGRWVVLVPNGYNSTERDGERGSGDAVLFVLDAEDGEDLEKIAVRNGIGDNRSRPNGLSSIAAITVDDDINVEYAYAGDLKGRMWKFDLRDLDSIEAYLLYDAGDDRPITGKPVIGRRPDGLPGRIVYFGTGQLLEPGDLTDTTQQAFYGVLDDDTCTNRTSACIRESSLVEQQISGTGSQRTVSDNDVDYRVQNGFFVELASGTSAERVISEPVLVGATVAFTTTVPDPGDCAATAENFLYVLNRATGGQPPNPPLVDARGQALLSSGLPVVGIRLDNDFPLGGLSLLASGDGRYSFNSPEANPAANLGRTGRLRWRQLR